MSGFFAKNSPYPYGGNQYCTGNNPNVPQQSLTLVRTLASPAKRPGMGDITTIGQDLANGDMSSVINDLLPTASLTNVLLWGAVAAWWWTSSHSPEKIKKKRAAALKKLEADYQLKKDEIDARYPTSKASA